VLDVQEVAKTYDAPGGPLEVLTEVTFALRPGESAAIMGPSGSGKSSLLYVLGGLERPTSGRVTLGGTDPYELDGDGLAAFRNRQVGFVFQDHCLLPQCTVIENVLVPTLVGDPDAGAAERAHALLDDVGLGERLDHRPAALSGGEKQRVALARALIRQPQLLLCDEPTGNLDVDSADRVAELLIALHRQQQTILVVVTHSTALAERFVSRWRIDRGHLIR
jgi:lipoprotein-releasing system ATP-binding protein